MSPAMPCYVLAFHLVVLLICAVASDPWQDSTDVLERNVRKAKLNALPRIRLNKEKTFHRQVEKLSKEKLHNLRVNKSVSEDTDPSKNMYSEQPFDERKMLTDFQKSTTAPMSTEISDSEKTDSSQSATQVTMENESIQYLLHSANMELNTETPHSVPTLVENGLLDSVADENRHVKDSRCPTCERRLNDMKYRKEVLRRQILKGTRMTNPPNATGRHPPSIPSLKRLLDQHELMMNDDPKRKRTHGSRYSSQYDDDDDDYISKLDSVFTFAKPSPMAGSLNVSNTIYFAPPIHLFTSKIKTAYLWFHIKERHASRSSYITLTVQRILPESLVEQRVILKTVFSQKLPKEKAHGWKRVDMRDILRRWIRHPMGNFGLVMKAYDETGKNLIELPPNSEETTGNEPWLETRIIESRSNSRHRRSESLVCAENSTETRCCRYAMTVGFAEFGWDWIIAPTHVQADQCSGECHMTMQGSAYTWMSQNTPGASESCCTPTKMSPLSLLYFDEEMNIVYQILNNVKVERCGCA